MGFPRTIALASVALLIGPISVPASAVAAQPAGLAADDGRVMAGRPAYWTATNHREGSGADEAGARHVVISGYHPAEGFEDEIAAERAALRRANAKAAPGIDPVD